MAPIGIVKADGFAGIDYSAIAQIGLISGRSRRIALKVAEVAEYPVAHALRGRIR
jgi:hypothetical protein